jgi:acetyl esterase/lipase
MHVSARLSVLVLAIGGCFGVAAEDTSPPPSRVSDDGVIQVPAFALPFSEFASPEARAAFVKMARMPPPTFFMPPDATVEYERKMMDEHYFGPLIEVAYKRYPVDMTVEKIGGVYTQVFVPKNGIAPENAKRVLINLHDGGFYEGARTASQIESVPVASVGRIKVISVDYRLAPEHRFPAASEDVAAVYRELLKTYRPEDIAVYGCSAGGRLAGQSMAWFAKEGLPMPAAVGIFCSATTEKTVGGDSARTTPHFGGMLPTTPPKWVSAYTEGQDPRNPLIAPSASPEVLAKFPPALFITGSRAGEMSAAAQSVIDLTKAGVEARLLVWDGMDHGFFYNPELPESHEAYELMTRFFREQFERARMKTGQRR